MSWIRRLRILFRFSGRQKNSLIYRELDAMEHCGWLTSERVIQNQKPNKRVYSITDSGKEELGKWLSSPETDIADAMRIRSAFLMRVFFAGETSIDQSLEMLRTYREQCTESSKGLSVAHDIISEYGAVVGDDRKAEYWKIAALYGKVFYDASLNWADKAIAILEEMKR